ncbi:methyltransferase [Cordyceps fumosorosea ARSEF 2679]|uniref:Methyltransferase n=1 Tax=Cordyceps fumosorosea (strain ARSEF 2679) TaxID=1081104 RepID=A0A167ZM51_CORFA|nr:methyltransferase [Cordyceps fumosorosea ARSEF 2679]OAA67681.1 methyltransferase [Cordyceps fumosorosea ARSEF 2679]
MSTTPPRTIYNVDPPPVDLIRSIVTSPSPPPTPAKPSYGIDSPLGLLLSCFAAPLYLYATLRGKSLAWDAIYASLPPSSSPALDVGCGRGLVLFKLAAARGTRAYGIDLFRTGDQTGNGPAATYRNAAALGLLDRVVLHEASFTESFPFADGAFGVVASSLALHNADRAGRRTAVAEMARVCGPGGRIVLVDLCGYFGDHRAVLEGLGWTDVVVSFVGWRMVFGIWPCQLLVATKPQRAESQEAA